MLRLQQQPVHAAARHDGPYFATPRAPRPGVPDLDLKALQTPSHPRLARGFAAAETRTRGVVASTGRRYYSLSGKIAVIAPNAHSKLAHASSSSRVRRFKAARRPEAAAADSGVDRGGAELLDARTKRDSTSHGRRRHLLPRAARPRASAITTRVITL